MQQTWQHILDGLCSVLKRDAGIRSDAFTEQFTAEIFADVLFSLMLLRIQLTCRRENGTGRNTRAVSFRNEFSDALGKEGI